MHARGRTSLAAALVLPLVLAGCTHGGSGGSGAGSTVANATSGSTPTQVTSGSLTALTTALAADDGTVPVILVHGITGDPSNFAPLLDRLAPGRSEVRALYAAEADALKPGDLKPDVIVAFGFYRDSVNDTLYCPDANGLSHGSIGACPVPRADGLDVSYYTTSYAARLKRCVEGVMRATGRNQVDLVCHSMGGLVGRAYTKWLSVDPSGHSAVRRVFLVASPSRGINALEAIGFGIAKTGPQAFMRFGEVVELCYEAREYNGLSYVEQLNSNWDGFCATYGIHYGGVSAYGQSLDMADITYFLQALPGLTWAQTGAIAAAVAVMWSDLPREITEALGPSDGTVRIESSELGNAPFLAADFWSVYFAQHNSTVNPEMGIAQATFTAETVRSYCLGNGNYPRGATASVATLTPIDAPGAATWMLAHITVEGPQPAVAAQLIESTLDASGNVTASWSYGCPLGCGDQHILFPLVAGGGTRSYQLLAYADHGPIGQVQNFIITLNNGTVEAAPTATIATTATTPTAQGPSVHATFTSNAASGDPALRYRVRFDGGLYGAWTAQSTFDTPPLAPGIHRLEVAAQSSSNAAHVTVDGEICDGADLIVDPSGNVTVVH
jgi:pimeloyl-ACP methyl ester carboxylesterase